MSATIHTQTTQTTTWPDGSTSVVTTETTTTAPVITPAPTPPADLTATSQVTGTQTITRSDGATVTVPIERSDTVPVTPSDNPDPPDPPDPVPTTGLAVIISMDGTEHVFAQDGAVDFGDYLGEHVAQHCYCATCDTLPAFRVMFRPDVDGSRDEVVFEYGEIFSGVPACILADYTATITRDGTTLATVPVHGHSTHKRWRWQSAPRPVIASVADLISAGLLPHYDANVCGGTHPAASSYYAGPMDCAGLVAYMPTTGERDELGLLTEQQADYVITCSDASLASVRAQLEASGSWQMAFRDENSHAPIDIYEYPYATCHDNPNGANPHIPPNYWYDESTAPDTAHMPTLGYLAYLLTGDPYALEAEQFTFTFNSTSQPAGKRDDYNVWGAVRAHSWALRTGARLARVTPETTPSWLKPRAYFRQWLDGNCAWEMGFGVNGAQPQMAYFQMLCPELGSMGELRTFMEDYEAATLGMVVELGFDDWRPILEWKIKSDIARVSTTSGWNRSQPGPYDFIVTDGAGGQAATDWASCWALNLAKASVQDTDPACLPADGDWTYPSFIYVSLAYGARLGIAEAQEGRDWLAAQFKARGPGALHTRWSIA